MGFGPGGGPRRRRRRDRPTGHRAGRRRRVRLEPERRRHRRRDGDRADVGRDEQRRVRDDRRPRAQALRDRASAASSRPTATPYSPDFAAIARAFGADGITIERRRSELAARAAGGLRVRASDGHRCADAEHAGHDARRVGHRADLPGRPMSTGPSTMATRRPRGRRRRGPGAPRRRPGRRAITATTDRQVFVRGVALDEAIGARDVPGDAPPPVARRRCDRGRGRRCWAPAWWRRSITARWHRRRSWRGRSPPRGRRR